ncbi:unnamed protein product [Fusarium graminearum]|uniref:Uncharacterized protein n=1 Tax=Gibberella zeae TaxID=5518 RepID=A0A4U9EMN4_GIBZA|nr:unnamed protein product [Fusarium graminearum]CAF3550631.1 unnamed protein product [Fusarium graminearum]CAG2003781.1 unnamed protein product [Fusarium graminearum]CAG2004435.1 unnamed protein product [Fusarium graminearum]VTO81699.1 unnamed protein product [Fusarium graminearum]
MIKKRSRATDEAPSSHLQAEIGFRAAAPLTGEGMMVHTLPCKAWLVEVRQCVAPRRPHIEEAGARVSKFLSRYPQ